MVNAIWKYEDGLYQPTEPIFVSSLGGKFDVWFDVEERLLNEPRYSFKQQAVWDEFCNISPDAMRQSFVAALLALAQRMDMLPDDAEPELGPTIYPKAMAKAARKTASALKATKKALGKQPVSVFKCDSIVVPVQDKASVGFVIMNFQIGAQKRPDQTDGYELESLFCDNCSLFVAENSGLWTRTEWAYNFNVPGFVPNNALKFHPYW